jgi:hypothetical protein
MLDVPHPDISLASWPLLPTYGTFGDKIDENHAYAWWFFAEIRRHHDPLCAQDPLLVNRTVLKVIQDEVDRDAVLGNRESLS